ncbi:MAG: type II secretion system minor pseudopilin GspK [Proteobacteria bacterium]|nr:type II secretion system minor pseudopilin GspK [Pseudomonadota bacterium]
MDPAMDSGRRKDKQSGIALVLTLLIISLLVAMTIQLMITVDRQITVATAQREQVRLDSMVLAGLNLARAALVADRLDNPKAFESPHDAWATLEPDQFASLSGEVALKVEVSALSGRLQVNALGSGGKEAYRQIWLRLLTSGRFAVDSVNAAEDLLDAIGDWIDADDEERHGGAETSYYQGLDPPYVCRNGPAATVEELLLVKGMTRALLFGDAGHEGLAGYITVLGDSGTVNLNTAPLPVLQALSPDMSPKLAQELIDYRNDRQYAETLAQTGWYRGVSGFPAAIEFSNSLLVAAGPYFEVRVTAAFHQFSRTGVGYLRRDDRGLTLLSWKVE